MTLTPTAGTMRAKGSLEIYCWPRLDGKRVLLSAVRGCLCCAGLSVYVCSYASLGCVLHVSRGVNLEAICRVGAAGNTCHYLTDSSSIDKGAERKLILHAARIVKAERTKAAEPDGLAFYHAEGYRVSSPPSATNTNCGNDNVWSCFFGCDSTEKAKREECALLARKAKKDQQVAQAAASGNIHSMVVGTTAGGADITLGVSDLPILRVRRSGIAVTASTVHDIRDAYAIVRFLSRQWRLEPEDTVSCQQAI